MGKRAIRISYVSFCLKTFLSRIADSGGGRVVSQGGGHFNFSWVQTSSQIASKLMINKQEHSNALSFVNTTVYRFCHLVEANVHFQINE